MPLGPFNKQRGDEKTDFWNGRRARHRQRRAGHGRDRAEARPRRRACFHEAQSARASQRRAGPKIVLGKDTRLSGYMLENALVAGITSLGVDVLLIGPLPTPGVAYITRSLRADAGIVLSASHNPYEDNGIKFFRHDGYKLDDKIEQQIEQLVFTGEIDSIRPTAGKIGRATSHRRRARSLRRVRQGQLPARNVARENAHRGRCRERRGLQIDALHSARTRRRRDRRARRTQRHEHQRRVRQHAIRRRFSASSRKAARRSASPTTATPIASCSAMKTANWSMATRSWRSPRSICCESGQLAREDAGRHGHEQLRAWTKRWLRLAAK